MRTSPVRRRSRWLALLCAGLLVTTAAGTAVARHERGGEREAERFEEEEGTPAGLEWFYEQRGFPNGIPAGAYQRAGDHARRMPVSDGRRA